MRSGGVMRDAVFTTCSIRVRPPARWSTFARFDFMRVPRPAARITTLIVGSISIPGPQARLDHAPPAAPFASEFHGDVGGGDRIVADDLAVAQQIGLNHVDTEV